MKNWFREKSDLWPGQCFSLEIKKMVYNVKSDYQEITIFDSEEYGRVLALDNIIQCTERDEFAYQEMLAFVPLSCHSNPKNVLIIGGGDGGVAREVCKHPLVKHITVCEIDAEVINAARNYLPFMASSFDNKKVEIFIGDGIHYVQDAKEKYDVIITDSSDPIGPAKILFESNYYKHLKSALRPGGIICSQGESIWLSLPFIKKFIEDCRIHFSTAKYATISIPTYPGGQIGILVASQDPTIDVSIPKWALDNNFYEKNLKYYNASVHQAAFILPQFAHALLA